MAKKAFYVWSGSLKGVKAVANTPMQAVEMVVRDNLPCVLSEAIRVSLIPRGQHPLDVFLEAPYEEQFPELFDGTLEITVARVERS